MKTIESKLAMIVVPKKWRTLRHPGTKFFRLFKSRDGEKLTEVIGGKWYKPQPVLDDEWRVINGEAVYGLVGFEFVPPKTKIAGWFLSDGDTVLMYQDLPRDLMPRVDSYRIMLRLKT